MSFERNDSPGAEVADVQIGASTFGTKAADAALPVAANFPFFYVHHWENWELETQGLDEPTWLPALQRESVRPGVDNHRQKRKPDDPDEIMYLDAQDLLRRKNITILSQEIRLDVGGHAVVGYADQAACRNPLTKATGTYHMERWSRPKRKREGQRLKFSFDRGAYNRWRLELVRQGFIAAPDETIIREKIDRAVYHRGRNAAKTGLAEDVRDGLVAKADARVAEMKAAALPTVEEPPPRPAPKRRAAAASA
jgi:hypothetical protein